METLPKKLCTAALILIRLDLIGVCRNNVNFIIN